jgi:hypothetical protein
MSPGSVDVEEKNHHVKQQSRRLVYRFPTLCLNEYQTLQLKTNHSFI